MKRNIIALMTGIAVCLASCAPTIHLKTPEPIQVNIAMEVDLTTHSADPENAGTTEEGKKNGEVVLSPSESRRNRIGEIQTLKNNRIVGEGNDGLLHIKEMPEDTSFALYAKETVEKENADRLKVFEGNSKDRGQPAEVIRQEFAHRARDASFPGEWVQSAVSEGGEWMKK